VIRLGYGRAVPEQTVRGKLYTQLPSF